jgi:hypothetical protein
MTAHRDAIPPPGNRDTERRLPSAVKILLDVHLDAVREEWLASTEQGRADNLEMLQLKARVRLTGRAWAAEEARMREMPA